MKTFDVDAMRRAHAKLRADLGLLEEAAGPSSETGIKGLCDRLAATRNHVADHFRLEEQNGYMDAFRTRQPRLERAIQTLRDDHADLLRALDGVIHNATRAISVEDPLREQVRNWLGELRQHEDRENRLIEDAYDLDVGPGD